MMFSGTPSRASSRACAWRSWCGAKRRLTPALVATRRNSVRTAAADHDRPRVGPSMMMQKSGPGRELGPCVQPRAELFPAPLVHADFASAATLAAADQDRSAPVVEVVLCERECFLDAQAGGPEDDDHRSHAPAVTVVGAVAHDRHDLVDHGRVGGIAQPLVARRAAGVVAGQVAGERRRPAASSIDEADIKTSSDRTPETARPTTGARPGRARRQSRTRARSFADGGVACLMHTDAVATSLTRRTDASTDATARPRPALVLAHGAEHVPRIRRARTVRSSFRCALSMRGMSEKGHSRTHTAVAAETAV